MKGSWLLLSLAAASAGCSTTQLYDGPKRPREEVVVIKGMSNWDISAGGYAVKVCAFDGKPFESCQPFIEFLPGVHTLAVELTYVGLPSRSKEITKDFQAGECLLGVTNGEGPGLAPAIFGCGK